MEQSFETFEIDFGELARQNDSSNTFYSINDFDSFKTFQSQNTQHEIKRMEQSLKNVVNGSLSQTSNSHNQSEESNNYRKFSNDGLSFCLSPTLLNCPNSFSENVQFYPDDSNSCSFRFNVESLPWENEDDPPSQGKIQFRDDRNSSELPDQLFSSFANNSSSHATKRCSNFAGFADDFCEFNCSPNISVKKPCVSNDQTSSQNSINQVPVMQTPSNSYSESTFESDFSVQHSQSLVPSNSQSNLEISINPVLEEIVDLDKTVSPVKKCESPLFNQKSKAKKQTSNSIVPQHRRPFDPSLHCGVLKDGVLCRRSLLCKLHSMSLKRQVTRPDSINVLMKKLRDSNKQKKLEESGVIMTKSTPEVIPKLTQIQMIPTVIPSCNMITHTNSLAQRVKYSSLTAQPQSQCLLIPAAPPRTSICTTNQTATPLSQQIVFPLPQEQRIEENINLQTVPLSNVDFDEVIAAYEFHQSQPTQQNTEDNDLFLCSPDRSMAHIVENVERLDSSPQPPPPYPGTDTQTINSSQEMNTKKSGSERQQNNNNEVSSPRYISDYNRGRLLVSPPAGVNVDCSIARQHSSPVSGGSSASPASFLNQSSHCPGSVSSGASSVSSAVTARSNSSYLTLEEWKKKTGGMVISTTDRGSSFGGDWQEQLNSGNTSSILENSIDQEDLFDPDNSPKRSSNGQNDLVPETYLKVGNQKIRLSYEDLDAMLRSSDLHSSNRTSISSSNNLRQTMLRSKDNESSKLRLLLHEETDMGFQSNRYQFQRSPSTIAGSSAWTISGQSTPHHGQSQEQDHCHGMPDEASGSQHSSPSTMEPLSSIPTAIVAPTTVCMAQDNEHLLDQNAALRDSLKSKCSEASSLDTENVYQTTGQDSSRTHVGPPGSYIAIEDIQGKVHIVSVCHAGCKQPMLYDPLRGQIDKAVNPSLPQYVLQPSNTGSEDIIVQNQSSKTRDSATYTSRNELVKQYYSSLGELSVNQPTLVNNQNGTTNCDSAKYDVHPSEGCKSHSCSEPSTNIEADHSQEGKEFSSNQNSSTEQNNQTLQSKLNSTSILQQNVYRGPAHNSSTLVTLPMPGQSMTSTQGFVSPTITNHQIIHQVAQTSTPIAQFGSVLPTVTTSIPSTQHMICLPNGQLVPLSTGAAQGVPVTMRPTANSLVLPGPVVAPTTLISGPQHLTAGTASTIMLHPYGTTPRPFTTTLASGALTLMHHQLPGTTEMLIGQRSHALPCATGPIIPQQLQTTPSVVLPQAITQYQVHPQLASVNSAVSSGVQVVVLQPGTRTYTQTTANNQAVVLANSQNGANVVTVPGQVVNSSTTHQMIGSPRQVLMSPRPSTTPYTNSNSNETAIAPNTAETFAKPVSVTNSSATSISNEIPVKNFYGTGNVAECSPSTLVQVPATNSPIVA